MTDHYETSNRSLRTVLRDVTLFSAVSGIRLRNYQRTVARAITTSVLRARGHRFVVLFPRQSGKNELQAQIEAYLLRLFSLEGGEIVKISPTYKPQALTSVRRLEKTLRANPLTASDWSRKGTTILRIGAASIQFLSGSPTANIVGATASLLLEIDEAQDILPAKFDRDIAPMAASRNATIVFWGTAWTADTLLARELALLRRGDTPQRAFVLSAPDVAAEVPEYGEFVAAQVARLGRDHPLVKTQFFSEMIDAQLGLFSERLIAALQGDHEYRETARDNERVVMLVDFAGGREESTAGFNAGIGANISAEPNRDRDRTVVTVVRAAGNDTGTEIIWEVLWRYVWLDRPIVDQQDDLLYLIERWRAGRIVLDGTGLGAGPASTLKRRVETAEVIPFIFTSSSKSDLGWALIALFENGRWREGRDAPPGSCEQLHYRDDFYRELRAVRGEISAGPEKRLRWSVPDGTRDPNDGSPVHDDLVMSAALITVAEEGFTPDVEVGAYGRAPDVLDDYDRRY